VTRAELEVEMHARATELTAFANQHDLGFVLVVIPIGENAERTTFEVSNLRRDTRAEVLVAVGERNRLISSAIHRPGNG
jgi:hypothetical protein